MGKTKVIVNRGEVIKRAREAAGLSRNYIARKLNVDVTSVTRWETNVNNIKADNLIKLNEIINVSELFDIRYCYKIDSFKELNDFIQTKKQEGYTEKEILAFLREGLVAKEEVRYV